MTTSGQTTSQVDQTRETGPNEHDEGVMTVQDAARLGPGDPITGRNGSKNDPATTLPPAETAHRRFPYPAWPTSQPGPQVTSPLPGSHPLLTDQMVYVCYDQERGLPCVSPAQPIMYKQGTKRPM